MAARNRKQRNLLLGALLFLTAGVTTLLNVPQLFFEPLFMWARVGIPILLVIGLVGTFLELRLLRLAGWMGIGLFVLVVLVTAIPGEDFTFGSSNPPVAVNGWFLFVRLLALVAVALLMAVCFKLTARAPTTPGNSTAL